MIIKNVRREEGGGERRREEEGGGVCLVSETMYSYECSFTLPHSAPPPPPSSSLPLPLQLKKYFTFEVQVLDDKNVRRRFRASNYQVRRRRRRRRREEGEEGEEEEGGGTAIYGRVCSYTLLLS